MKFKIAAMCAMMVMMYSTLTSCDEDSRTGVQGYPDCAVCHGKGYCQKSALLGLTTSYWDCILCKSRSVRHLRGGYGPSFKGSGVARGSCNISPHQCPGYESNGHSSCANCAANGYDCHAVAHQPIQ